jgi:hypothetical protein
MTRLVLVVAATLVALTVGPAAYAQEPSDASGDALVRVAHLSPDAPAVDVYVDGGSVITNMGFEIVSDYLALPPGPHRVELRPTGTAAAAPAVLTQDVTLESGAAYTVAGVGPLASLGLRVFEDDLAAPPAGSAFVRVIHGAIDAPTVDLVTTSGTTLVADAAPAAATPYAAVPAGTYDLVVQDSATAAVLLTAPPVELGAGITYTIAVVGGGAEPARLLPLVDARAAAVTPAGAVATGMGGAAGDDEPVRSVRVSLVAAVVAGALLLACGRRVLAVRSA